MSEPFIGEIRVAAFSFAPRGWALCNGQLLPINQNQALFSILGTTYGGNGQTNFALPNLQGRIPLHTGGSFALGQTGGQAAHTLLASEMPQHTHLGNAQSAPATPGDTPSSALPAAGPVAIYGTSPSVPMSGAAVTASGGSQPHENQPPYLVVSMMIALVGVYPSQN